MYPGGSNYYDHYDAKSGVVASSFRDIMNLRRYDPPIIDVTEAVIKSGSAGKHHEYRIIGHDHTGGFDVLRRFKHFYLLRDVLNKRFLGLYIPPIPSKKKLVLQLSF